MATADRPGLPGVHHITAICGDPQANLEFYAGLLGLRLVEKTVNFDDPGTYHLYYGDGLGSPGTILTFFAWISVPPLRFAQGRPGTGQVTAVPFSIPVGSLDFWTDRLAAAAVDFDGPEARFDETVVSLRDPDGLPLELVPRGGAPGVSWPGAPVPPAHAIRGFAGATLCVSGHEGSAALLTEALGLREDGREGARLRFRIGEGDAAACIDLLGRPEGAAGRTGIGTVHHIAWRTPRAADALRWRDVLAAAGRDVTPVLDRRYFHSIYFREPGGVLFEIATDDPGFTIDEPPEALGSALMLPTWLEPRRERIEARLPELRVPRPAWPARG